MRINKKVNNDSKLLELNMIIVKHARRGEYSDAASQMNIFLQKFQAYLKSGFISSDRINDIAYSLETVLMLQEQNDWVAVADILEFELAKFIKG